MKVGDMVMKVSGYAFDGRIVAIQDIEGTGVRYLVQQKEIFENGRRVAGGAIHIFSVNQIAPI